MKVTQLMVARAFGGVERSFVDTCLALHSVGIEVQAICDVHFPMRGYLEEHGLRVDPLRVRNTWDPLAQFRIERRIARFGADVIHCHASRGARIGGAAGRRLAIPVVSTLHNYAKLKYYRHVDLFIATTEAARRYLAAQGIAANRIVVIPHFCTIPPASEVRTGQSDEVVFVVCGRLSHVKGYDVLLGAFRRARESAPTARLIIGGDGPEYDRLVALAGRLGLAEHVEFRGWVTDVAELLREGDIFVSPSRNESFGIAILEAMACGIPIVTTRTSGPSHFLDDSTAFFAQPDDECSLAAAMVCAAHDRRLRQDKAREALNRFRATFVPERVLPQITATYESVGSPELVTPA